MSIKKKKMSIIFTLHLYVDKTKKSGISAAF